VRVEQHGLFIEGAASGRQVQASRDGDGRYRVAERARDTRQSFDSFRVGSPGATDEDTLAEDEYVAAIERGGRCDTDDFALKGQNLLDGCDFSATRRCSGACDNRYLFENDGGVGYETAIRILIQGFEGDNFHSAAAKEVAVASVLPNGIRVVHALALPEGQLATVNVARDGSRNRL
jgi:hypothetical protein